MLTCFLQLASPSGFAISQEDIQNMSFVPWIFGEIIFLAFMGPLVIVLWSKLCSIKGKLQRLWLTLPDAFQNVSFERMDTTR